MQELERLFQSLRLEDPGKYYLLTGDLNAKHTEWGNSTNNGRGTSLNAWYLQNQITYKMSLRSTNTPSYPKSSGVIDLCIADNRINFYDLIAGKIECIEYNSDHKALQMKISVERSPLLVFDKEAAPQRKNFNKAN